MVSINWNALIERDKDAVVEFALGQLSADSFQQVFSGRPNIARGIVRNHGANRARSLAKTALKRRNILV